MRFVLAFVAILVVSWTSCGQVVEDNYVKKIAFSFENPDAVGDKSVKKIVSSFENTGVVEDNHVKKLVASFENPPDKTASSSGRKMVVIHGKERSVKELIESYEKFKNSLKESPKTAPIPEIPDEAGVEASLKEGKQLEETHPLCNIEDPKAKATLKKQPWYCSLCHIL